MSDFFCVNQRYRIKNFSGCFRALVLTIKIRRCIGCNVLDVNPPLVDVYTHHTKGIKFLRVCTGPHTKTVNRNRAYCSAVIRTACLSFYVSALVILPEIPFK